MIACSGSLLAAGWSGRMWWRGGTLGYCKQVEEEEEVKLDSKDSVENFQGAGNATLICFYGP